ncbi:uncharacterized protein BDV14DRAFT_26691 [Aspergillus stella-maris]|uniref:uncharacterized protein n=1 Tax=Aspergillus stella-maris TaxID=1810926 RepID=UPI003CCD27AA
MSIDLRRCRGTIPRTGSIYIYVYICISLLDVQQTSKSRVSTDTMESRRNLDNDRKLLGSREPTSTKAWRVGQRGKRELSAGTRDGYNQTRRKDEDSCGLHSSSRTSPQSAYAIVHLGVLVLYYPRPRILLSPKVAVWFPSRLSHGPWS